MALKVFELTERTQLSFGSTPQQYQFRNDNEENLFTMRNSKEFIEKQENPVINFMTYDSTKTPKKVHKFIKSSFDLHGRSLNEFLPLGKKFKGPAHHLSWKKEKIENELLTLTFKNVYLPWAKNYLLKGLPSDVISAGLAIGGAFSEGPALYIAAATFFFGKGVGVLSGRFLKKGKLNSINSLINQYETFVDNISRATVTIEHSEEAAEVMANLSSYEKDFRDPGFKVEIIQRDLKKAYGLNKEAV